MTDELLVDCEGPKRECNFSGHHDNLDCRVSNSSLPAPSGADVPHYSDRGSRCMWYQDTPTDNVSPSRYFYQR